VHPICKEFGQYKDEDVEILKLLLEDLPLKKAVQISTRISGKKKNDIYQQALQLNELIS
jgi:16S rRNA (cytidine1402-2'-O)-methyltransferase